MSLLIKPGANTNIKKGINISKIIINKLKYTTTLIVNNLKNSLANDFPFFSINKEYMGNKAEVRAPSAVIRLNKLGNLKAIRKMSE